MLFQSEKRREEKEKLDLYLEKQNNMWDMKVTVIPIVVGALETVSKNLGKKLREFEIRGRIETILATAVFKSARIIGVLEIFGRLALIQTSEKNKANVKNSL